MIAAAEYRSSAASILKDRACVRQADFQRKAACPTQSRGIFGAACNLSCALGLDHSSRSRLKTLSGPRRSG
jgi:hypothetical protein